MKREESMFGCQLIIHHLNDGICDYVLYLILGVCILLA